MSGSCGVHSVEANIVQDQTSVVCFKRRLSHAPCRRQSMARLLEVSAVEMSIDMKIEAASPRFDHLSLAITLRNLV